MKRVFADTFLFFAFLNPRDAAHREACRFLDEFNGDLITTEWVLTELADGFATVENRRQFMDFHSTIRTDPSMHVIEASGELFQEGMNLYSARPDKEWTLTDCISFVVMKREGLELALTGDHHFAQAGFRIHFK